MFFSLSLFRLAKSKSKNWIYSSPSVRRRRKRAAKSTSLSFVHSSSSCYVFVIEASCFSFCFRFCSVVIRFLCSPLSLSLSLSPILALIRGCCLLLLCLSWGAKYCRGELKEKEEETYPSYVCMYVWDARIYYADKDGEIPRIRTVSYTHLTLPTTPYV